MADSSDSPTGETMFDPNIASSPDGTIHEWATYNEWRTPEFKTHKSKLSAAKSLASHNLNSWKKPDPNTGLFESSSHMKLYKRDGSGPWTEHPFFVLNILKLYSNRKTM